MPKVIEIILTEPYRTNAARVAERTRRLGEHGVSTYPGPRFVDAKAKVGPGAVEVTTKDGVVRVYPLHVIASVKVSDEDTGV